MAISALEQAYLDQVMPSGGATSGIYWGTTLTGGYGSIAGGTNNGGGKKGTSGKGAEPGDPIIRSPGAIPVKDGKLPFEPKSYTYYDSYSTVGPNFYYNGFYMENGRKVPCDGWVWWEAASEAFKLPACPTDQPATKKPPLVSYYDWP